MFLLKKKKSAADDIHVHEFLETLSEPGQSISVSIFSIESLQWIHGSKAAERHLTAQIQTSALPRILRSFSL